MTEQISLIFNSCKYPDGTIRNQFKIIIQSHSFAKPKTEPILKIPSIYDKEIYKRMAQLTSKDREISSDLMREQKKLYK